MYDDRKYVILNASEVGTINFSQVMETSADTLRYSLDDSQTFVKFDGDTPSFLSGKTVYSYSDFKIAIDNADWVENFRVDVVE